jgi:hypothetical protein
MRVTSEAPLSSRATTKVVALPFVIRSAMRLEIAGARGLAETTSPS